MSGGSGKVPTAYNPTGSGQQDQNEQTLLNNLYMPIANSMNSLQANTQATMNNILTNPDAQGAYNWANSVATEGLQLGGQGIQRAQDIYGMGQYGQSQIAPQQQFGANALYGMGAQQTQDAGRAMDAQRALLGQQLGYANTMGDQGAQLGARGGDLLNTTFDRLMPQQLQAAQQLYDNATQQNAAGSSLLSTQMGQLLPEQLRAAMQAYGMGDTLQGAGTAALGNEFGNILPQQLQAAQAQYGAGNVDMSLVNPLYQSAFDPQRALYSRDMAKLLDITNAQSSAQGLGGSPFATGLANDQARNFQIDWENNQLGRELQGAQGIAGLTGAASSAYAGGANTAGNAQSGLLSTLQGAYTPALEAYGMGQGMQNSATGAAMNVANNAFTGSQNSFMGGQQMQGNAVSMGLNTLAGAYAPSQQAYMNSQAVGNNANAAFMNANNNAYTGAQNSYLGGNTIDQSIMQTLGQSADLYGAGLSMDQSALNTMQTAGMLPYETRNAIQMNNLGAEAMQADVNQANFAPSLSYANAANQYLGVGQNAVKLNQQAQEQQFQQNQATWQGIGSIAGSLFNVASNPFSVFGKQMWG